MMFVALPPAAPAGAPPARRDVWAALLKDTLRSVTAIVGPVAQRGNRVAPASTLMGVRG